MADLHLIGGEKGGTGKSFLARALIQYHLDNDIACSVFDTDRSNPDLMRLYGEASGCKVGVFSEGERYEDTANAIFNAAIAQRTICNLPAQVYIPVKQWVERNELFELAKEADVQFYQWFVSDCGSDSLKLFARSLKEFGKNMPHIFVKNLGMTDDWEPFDSDETLQGIIKNYDVLVIEFPKFIGNKDRNFIDNQNLTFAAARENPDLGPISRQRVKTFLRKAYEAFDSVPSLSTSGKKSKAAATPKKRQTKASRKKT